MACCTFVAGIKSFLMYTNKTEIQGLTLDERTQALAPISKIASAIAVDFHAGKCGL